MYRNIYLYVNICTIEIYVNIFVFDQYKYEII